MVIMVIMAMYKYSCETENNHTQVYTPPDIYVPRVPCTVVVHLHPDVHVPQSSVYGGSPLTPRRTCAAEFRVWW